MQATWASLNFAEEAGIHVEKTTVGDRYVLQNMLEHGHLHRR